MYPHLYVGNLACANVKQQDASHALLILLFLTHRIASPSQLKFLDNFVLALLVFPLLRHEFFNAPSQSRRGSPGIRGVRRQRSSRQALTVAQLEAHQIQESKEIACEIWVSFYVVLRCPSVPPRPSLDRVSLPVIIYFSLLQSRCV